MDRNFRKTISKAKCVHKFRYGGFSSCDVEWVTKIHRSFNMILLRSQTLKYAFQTHDRLCFVMEYANGGEVRPCVTVTWRHTNVTCCLQQLNVLSETDQLYICPFAFSSFSTCHGNECLQKTGHDSMVQRLYQHSSTSIHVMLYTVISRWFDTGEKMYSFLLNFSSHNAIWSPCGASVNGPIAGKC